MIGYNPNATQDYVVKDERGFPLEQQTVFKLKNISMKDKEQLDNNLSLHTRKADVITDKLLTGTRKKKALELCLAGWDNFNDADGKPIPFNRENMDCIPSQYREELAWVILGETELLEDEEKN